ncbi:MAG TPA: cbb3-type cytochrome c oxidase subunit I [Gaiellaceae bacterium]|nr:cbb3-type cytochrome c oxidase subunit I [Gaiellaceae bacterium]
MATEAATVFHPTAPALADARSEQALVGWLYGVTAVAVVGLMGLAGLALRLSQADILQLSPGWFYRLMTLHGAGMLTGTLVAMMGALWYVLRPTVPLRVERMLTAWGAIAAGAALVILSTLAGGFATGWTFLYPLPFLSVGAWDEWATVLFLAGLLLVGVGFLLFCVDVLAAVVAKYVRLSRALGIAYLRGRDDDPPPPAVIAGTVVAIDGLLALTVGTTIVVAELGRTFDSGVTLDALWAKNLTYFFGHSLANLIIYLAAGAIYVLLPRYAGRPWPTTKPIVVGWLATLLFVATAYSHHLYMDFVQPNWAGYVSLGASVAASIPVAVVTAYTGLMLVWGSSYRWTLASTLLYLGFLGWLIGGVGAVIDSLIPLNFRFHNTLWVVAHFHTYMLMGVVVWAVAFVAFLVERSGGRTASQARTWLGVGAMVVGGFGLVAMWYVSGALGLPRRYAVQPVGTEGYSVAGAVFALVFAAGFLLVVLELGLLARRAYRARLTGAGAADEEAELPEPADPGPGDVPLATLPQVVVALGLGAVALVALIPPINDAVADEVRWHHVQHALVFVVGVLLGLVLGSAPDAARRVGAHLPGVSLGLVVLAPAVLMLLMVPGVYGDLEDDGALHLAYHLAVIALGVLTGLGAARLGRVTGRIVALLAVAMPLLYAAGVTGG